MQNVQDILNVLDDHGFLDTDTNTKVAFLNDTIADFCAREPWPFLEAEAVSLTFDGINAVPTAGVPANFRAILTVIDPSTGRKILWSRVDSLENAAAQLVTQVGAPMFYYFVGSQPNFAPIPTSDVALRMRGLVFHPMVNSDSDVTDFLIPQRHWMALVFGTLTRLYDMDDDPEMSLRFEQHFEARIQQIRNELWQTQFDSPDNIVITDPDYLIDFPV